MGYSPIDFNASFDSILPSVKKFKINIENLGFSMHSSLMGTFDISSLVVHINVISSSKVSSLLV